MTRIGGLLITATGSVLLTAKEVKEVEDHIDQLEDENAKLRAERDEWHRVAESKQDIIDHMRDARAENDKLRKLLSSYWKAVHCLATPNVPRDYLAEMREMGIEVDR